MRISKQFYAALFIVYEDHRELLYIQREQRKFIYFAGFSNYLVPGEHGVNMFWIMPKL
jgi:hypothetical protein